MLGQPLVSVIMGVYNGERFLQEAIESVLEQSYSNIEFLICDDCSSDGTANILKEYAQKDRRIRLIKNEKNMGLATSLNRCIQLAKGELIARMDCDDRCALNRFEIQVQFLQINPRIDVVGTGVYFIDDCGQVFGQKNDGEVRVVRLQDAVKCNQLIHPTVMMRKSSINEVGGYSVNELTMRAEDYDLWCKMCEKGRNLCVIPESLFFYREDVSNIVKRKYRYRIQEAKLKKYWIRRTNMPRSYLWYVVKPLIVGLIPLPIYKILHRRSLTNN